MKRILALLIALILAIGLWISAQADIAPPGQPPGSNPEPGSEFTQVRMVAEKVVVQVLNDDPPKAKITADFTMLNLGNKNENMAVRFPISASDGRGSIPEIKNVAILVNGQAAGYKRVDGPEIYFYQEDKLVPWAEFNVIFPAGKEVEIRVSYDLDGTGYPDEYKTEFYYLMHTGAGWKDTIGSAEVILRLPYEASPLNVIIPDEAIGEATFEGNEVTWNFSNIEPGVEHNFKFVIVKPVVWNGVVIERENLEQNPEDGEAWGRLGKAYKEACFAANKRYARSDESAYLLYTLSRGAYEKALNLLPDDGLWHAGYANLLLDYNEFQWKLETIPEDVALGFQELQIAYQLAPDAEIVQELLSRYATQNDDGTYDFAPPERDSVATVPTPTVTPAASQTQEASRPGLIYYVTDEFDAVVFMLPTDWGQNLPAPWYIEDKLIGSTISASSDLEAYFNWGAAGATISVSRRLDKGHIEMMDEYRDVFAEACDEYKSRWEYENDYLRGMRQRFWRCSGINGPTLDLLALVDKNDPPAYTAMVTIVWFYPNEYQLTEDILLNFIVLPESLP